MKRIVVGLTILFYLFCAGYCEAQYRISGKVVNEANEPVANANALLLRDKDSLLVKGMITSTSGNYVFENIPAGNYLITSTFSGCKQVYTKSFELKGSSYNHSIETVMLLKKDVELSKETVIAKKPLFEQKIDRMVINVANSITNAGSTVLQVLERSPGIIVDRQNNSISVNGKNGIVVMINGR